MPEPVTFAEAAAHLRLAGDTSEQTLIEGYIVAAREWFENYTGHILVQREFVERRSSFGRFIELHQRPIVSPITSIQYHDTDGALQNYADWVERIDAYPARLYPELDGSWPSLGLNGEVIVTFTAGYALAADMPQRAKQAVLLLVGHWYSVRETVNVGNIVTEVPFAVQALADQMRGKLAVIPAGQRDRLITFERGTTTTDDYGGGTPAYATLATAWAKVLFGSGQERREAAQESAQITATFMVNWNPSLAEVGPTDRIVFDGDVYGIVSVAPIGRNSELHFTGVKAA